MVECEKERQRLLKIMATASMYASKMDYYNAYLTLSDELIKYDVIDRGYVLRV